MKSLNSVIKNYKYKRRKRKLQLQIDMISELQKELSELKKNMETEK